ncbi:Os01g0337550 [Oryza sativa Japonica Group]|nr:Os01g0337550 [Oryza sativa Japonica Group]
MDPTCHSPPLSSSSPSLQSSSRAPTGASGIGGGDAAEVVAKALSHPAATPSLPRRTRKATTAALGGQIEDDGVDGQIKEEEPLRGKGGEGRAVAVVSTAVGG